MEGDIKLRPIGIVKSDIYDRKIMPLEGIEAKIEVFQEFVDALYRIQESSHLWILSWFHEAPRDKLRIVPMKVNPNSEEFGVFALRAPARPNPIALTLVKVIKVEENVLYVTGMDAIDATPVLDIKPYFLKDVELSFRAPDIRKKSERSDKSYE